VYQVIRKEWDENAEGVFEPDPEYDMKSWVVTSYLLHEYDPEDEDTHVFAVVFRDEDNPPMSSSKELSQRQSIDPCFNVIFDPEDEYYKCETCGDYGCIGTSGMVALAFFDIYGDQ
jgi:hypothetical protein